MILVELEGQSYRQCTVKYQGMRVEALINEDRYQEKLNEKNIYKLKCKNYGYQFIKKKLWTIFSLYIRDRDGNTCVCCDATKPNIIQAGHYFPKSAYSGIYFDERNVHAQCATCNMSMEDPMVKANYTNYMLGRYGQTTLNLLEHQGKQKGLTSSEMEVLIAYYKKKLDNH